MKIKNLLNYSVLGIFLAAVPLNAQENKKIQPCNTYAAMEEAFAANPAARENYEKAQDKLRNEYLQYTETKNAHKGAAVPVYTIPVVFHILHEGGSENISDATVISALDYVNKDFARTNTDANQTVPQFSASYIDSEIRFMLAKKDPSGNCTSGIVRHITDKATWNQGATLTNYVYTWDPTKYLNIYIVKSIVPTGTTVGTIVGYTYKPGTWPTQAPQDAIVYRYDYLTGGDNPRSLTHEIGHWLNLSHTWGNTNQPEVACGDDGISDTPETKGEFGSCPASTISACVQTNTLMNNLNNVQNIMNYSGCPRNFTTGQTNAMRSAAVSSTSGRNNLWSPANLTATDINGAGNCAPISDFLSTSPSEYTVCQGQSISSFKDFSYNAAVTTWSWSATNGATITAPTSSITSMYFPNAGISVITLSVGNSQGGSVSSRSVTVLNGAATATTVPLESFEGSGLPPNWGIKNTSGIGWTQTSGAALHGTFSFMLDGTISSSLQEDILIMPIMDFAANPGATLRFSYAYRRKSTTHNDVFKVQLSDDCGATWKDVFAPSAANLALNSGGVGTTNFVPIASEWKTQDVSSHPNYISFTASSSVWGRFYFQEANGGFGNKMYIDSVNLVSSPPNGINELTQYLRLTLSPNPTKGSASLSFILSSDADVKVNVIDIAGKLVSEEKSYKLFAGSHKIELNDNATLPNGIYIVNLEYNGTKMARKLIIE